MTLVSDLSILPLDVAHLMPHMVIYDEALQTRINELTTPGNDFIAKFFRLIEQPNKYNELKERIEEAVFSKTKDNQQKYHAVTDYYAMLEQLVALRDLIPNPITITQASISCRGIQMIVPMQLNPNIGVVFFRGINSNQIFVLTSDRESKELNYTLHLFDGIDVNNLTNLNSALVSEISGVTPIDDNLSNRYAQIII